MSAKYRILRTGARKTTASGKKIQTSGKKTQHEPNLGQKEAREEKEKASDLAHMGEMSDQSQSKR